jgi:hypothetical protein
MAKEKSTKKTNNDYKNFMSYCEDLSTFLDQINSYCNHTYENDVPKNQKYVTYQAIRNHIGHDKISNKSEATHATQFMNQQLKKLLESGVLVHSKKASQKKMTIVGKLYVDMPNYFKDNVEAISERLTNASICEPSEESTNRSSDGDKEESNTEMTTENLQQKFSEKSDNKFWSN